MAADPQRFCYYYGSGGGYCCHGGGWSQANNTIFQLGDLNSKDSQAQNLSNC